MKFIGIIPARYASTRFPAKPLALLGGKPVIQRVYEQVAGVLDEAYVATDDERIERAVAGFGGRAIMTSTDHRSGTDRCREALDKAEALCGERFDIVVNIQGDEPVINPEMIQEVISIFFEDETVTFGSLKKEITDPDEIKATSTVKVVTDQKGDAMYFSRSVIPSNVKDGKLARVFRHVGIYAYKRDFLEEFSKMSQTELELGEGIEPLRAMERGYKMRLKETKHSSIGVDLPEHIEKVERVIKGIDTLD